MSTVTQIPAGWSFVYNGRSYMYPTRELAREALYDLQQGRRPTAAIDAARDEALAKVDPQDRPFCTAISEWLDRVPQSHQGYAAAGLLLIEIACKADEDLGALDEDEQTALGIYSRGWEAGRADLMVHLKAEVRRFHAERADESRAAYQQG